MFTGVAGILIAIGSFAQTSNLIILHQHQTWKI
jgi:hypothetical protein